MAGAFSGHLIDSHYSAQFRSMGPFGQPATPAAPISVHGAMSFNPQMHGSFPSQTSFSVDNHESYMELSEATARKIANLQAKLNQRLGPEFLSQRPGPGGGAKLTYAEGWKVINLANEVFGFNGWSSNIVNLTTDFIDHNEESRRFTVGVTAIVRVTLRDGVFHEDVGYGMLENSKSKGAALDKCKKEAVTDALKRCLRNFGNLLGNCLYDKQYIQEVVKIKVPPPKFDKSTLYRRPEFEENPNVASTSTTPAAASTSTSATASSSRTTVPPTTNTPNTRNAPNAMSTPAIKTERPQNNNQFSNQRQQTSLSSVPSHLRPNNNQTPQNASASSSGTPMGMGMGTGMGMGMGKGKAPDRGPGFTGLNTPITTPAHPAPIPNPNPPRKVAFNMNDTTNQPPAPAPAAPPPNNPNLDEFGDDSFHFYSDDDAFLAAVDLGEGDLGRPIDFNEGAGDLSVMSEDTSVLENSMIGLGGGGGGYGAAQQQSTNLQQQQGSSSRNGLAQQNQNQNPSRNVMNTTTTTAPPSRTTATSGTAAAGMLSSLLPKDSRPQQQQQQQPQRPPYNNAEQFRQANQANVAQQQQQGPNSNRVKENQHPAPPPPPQSDTFKRPITPSAGGFHFPPGVTPPGSNPAGQGMGGHQSMNQTPQLQQNRSAMAGQGSSSGVGMKRNSDAMQASTSGARRPAQGMGLMAAGQGSGQRAPLGRLDVGDGGEIKRVKR